MNNEVYNTVAFVLPSLGGGGAERVVLNYLANLNECRLRLILISFEATQQQLDAIPPHIEHFDLAKKRLRNAIPTLFSLFYRIRPNVIFSTIQHVNIAVLALRPFLHWHPKIIIREPNLPSRQLPVLNFSKIMQAAYQIFYPRADMIIAPSQQIIDELIECFKIKPTRTSKLANPVNVDFVRLMARPVLRQQGSGLRLVSAGSLAKQKGLDRLLVSFSKMPADSHLTILGAGPLKNQLLDLSAELGCSSRVEFAGFVENPWPYFAGADALLISSKWEGMPNVALEALACGVPVVGSHEAGGLVEIASDAVLLAEPGAEMNNAVMNLMRNEAMILRPSALPEQFHVRVATKVLAKVLLSI